jgi:TonB-like protein
MKRRMNHKFAVILGSIVLLGALAFTIIAVTARVLPGAVTVSDVEATWNSTKTFSHGTFSRIIALPSALFGYVTAKNEIVEGRLSLDLWGLPSPWREAYSDLIRARFGVQSRVVAGCVVSHFQLAEWSAHNQVVIREIESRYGHGALAACAADAQLEYQRNFRRGTLPASSRTSTVAPQVPAIAEENGPYRVSGEVHAPTAIERVEPDFSKCKGTYSGVPVAEGIVRADGSIQNLRLLRSVDPCIDAAVLSALQQWKFRPGTLKGKPVDVFYDVTVHIHYR